MLGFACVKGDVSEERAPDPINTCGIVFLPAPVQECVDAFQSSLVPLSPRGPGGSVLVWVHVSRGLFFGFGLHSLHVMSPIPAPDEPVVVSTHGRRVQELVNHGFRHSRMHINGIARVEQDSQMIAIVADGADRT